MSHFEKEPPLIGGDGWTFNCKTKTLKIYRTDAAFSLSRDIYRPMKRLWMEPELEAWQFPMELPASDYIRFEGTLIVDKPDEIKWFAIIQTTNMGSTITYRANQVPQYREQGDQVARGLHTVEVQSLKSQRIQGFVDTVRAALSKIEGEL